MNRKAVARRLLAVAKSLVGVSGDTAFTIMKPIRFKPEHGTRNSLENARMIVDAGYRFVKGVYTYDTTRGGWELQAFFDRDGETAIHTFNGFSFGYGGEGPHGLLEFGQIFGLGLKADKILVHDGAGLPEKGTVDLVQAFG